MVISRPYWVQLRIRLCSPIGVEEVDGEEGKGGGERACSRATIVGGEEKVKGGKWGESL